MLSSEEYALPAGFVVDVSDALHPHCRAALADWAAAAALDLTDLAGASGPGASAAGRPSGPLPIDVPVAELCDHDLLETLAAQEEAVAALHSAQVEVLAEFGRRRTAAAAEEDPADPLVPHSRRDFAADELTARMRWTAWTARHRLGEAERLAACLPATWTALADGRVDYPRVRRIVNATWELTEADAAAVDAVVADAAEGLTTAQLDELLAAEVAAVDAAASARRAARAAERRRVGVTPLPDGMARLVAEGPAPDVLTMFRGITAAAQQQQREEQQKRRQQAPPSAGDGEHDATAPDPVSDPRGIDARRFDVLTDWSREVLDGHAGPPGSAAWRPHVLVTVPLATLLGDDENPGHLHGYGPLPAVLARAAATEGTLRRLLTDPAGVVVGVDGHTHPGGLGLPDLPPDDPPPSPSGRDPDGGSGPGGGARPGGGASAGGGARPGGGASAGGGASPIGGRNPASGQSSGGRDGPVTDGCPLTGTATGYRPSAALTRLVRYRDVTCTAIGCRRPAAACDLDHVTPHPAGPTCACNLHPLCRRHHRMKHRTATEVRRLTDGSTVWTLPTGHTYTRPARAAVHRPTVRSRARPGVGGRVEGRESLTTRPPAGRPSAGRPRVDRQLPDSARHELRTLLMALGELPPEEDLPGYQGPPPF